MTDGEKLIAKMDRKALSLSNITKRYRTACNSTYRQIDAYDETADQMKDAGLWGAWCSKNGKALGHTAHDYFA